MYSGRHHMIHISVYRDRIVRIVEAARQNIEPTAVGRLAWLLITTIARDVTNKHVIYHAST